LINNSLIFNPKKKRPIFKKMDGDNMNLVAEKADILLLRSLFDKQLRRSAQLREEPIKERKVKLRKMEKWLFKNQEALQQAIYNDFQKPPFEVSSTELFPVLGEISQAVANLERWTKPKKVDAPLTYFGTRSEIRYEPKGVCLIIAPWNYPFNLCIGPLISCLAAGNTAMVKPSEMTPHTSAFIKRMIDFLFAEEEVVVLEGGTELSSALLGLPFDHIFFTGSPAVGKVVMKAAAEHLTSVTLELGGKSPAVIDEAASLSDAAKRIAFGKFFNNGQTCIAPDYVLVHESKKDAFIALLKKQINAQFGLGNAVNETSGDYARIVNQKHFKRINELIQDALLCGAKLDLSGQVNEQTRFIPPTVLSDVPLSSKIMEEEIFGPVLPIISYAQQDEVVSLINSKPKPLALYVFTASRKFREKMISQTSAGSICINDCVLQFTHPNLPFGGVNNSGIGKAHGYYGFLAFSNEKPLVRQKRGWANSYFFYPPYTKSKKKLIDLILQWFI
jgi:aldehyde dehydrogenase (NAD+)